MILAFEYHLRKDKDEGRDEGFCATETESQVNNINVYDIIYKGKDEGFYYDNDRNRILGKWFLR